MPPRRPVRPRPIYRRNADDRIRRLERAAAGGDLLAHSTLLRERLRLGLVTPERIAMAAYLGHPAARAIGIPPLTRIRAEPWDYGSFSLELLNNGPVSPREATLFAADCCMRSLAAFGLSHREEGTYETAVAAVEAARTWVLGGIPTPGPGELGRVLFNLIPRSELRDDVSTFSACQAAADGCRSKPSEITRDVVRYTLSAVRQNLLGAGVTLRDVPESVLLHAQQARTMEARWQDAHFAKALLEPEWPMVTL